MKQLILSLFACAFYLTGISQSCSDLFISEYCEGSGNNKGIELYNPTPALIDLSAYEVHRYSNGELSPSEVIQLEGIIEPYATWVIVNGQTENIELGGGSISPAADPLMQAYADQFGGGYPDPMYFNGDDALVLFKNDNVVVDIFGKPGEDPGVAWTDNADAGYTDADGGEWLTANKTLRRKPTILQGVTTVPIQFYALAEYDSLPSNTWTGLGIHECACDPDFGGDIPGCTDPVACNFDFNAALDDGSCEYESCAGCLDPTACNYDPTATLNSNDCSYPGCTQPGACNYDFFAGCEDGSCYYADAIYDCNGDCQLDSDNDGICDQLENQDGSQFCGPGTYWDEDAQMCLTNLSCAADFDLNGIINANDLLFFLASFGTTCN